MSIPCKMRPAGLESLPMGYTRLDFLESTGPSYPYINTGVNATGNLTTRVTVLTRVWDGGNNTNLVFGARSSTHAYSLSLNYNRGDSTLPKLGAYGYGSLGMHGMSVANSLNTKYEFVYDKNILKRDGQRINAVALEEFSVGLSIYLFGQHAANSWFSSKVIYHFSIAEDGRALLNYIPALDPTGKPCMFDTVTKQPFHNGATTGSDFIAGMTLGQALKLKDLPAKTATLDISLPEGYESNAEVMESIQQAEEKGWTFNINTYTPT